MAERTSGAITAPGRSIPIPASRPVACSTIEVANAVAVSTASA